MTIQRAFVCSTFEDLREHRAYVINALRKSGFFVDPMEDWTAAAQEPRELSLNRIRGCQLCILLVGFRRGHIPDGQSSSITQLEYRAAINDGIDVLVFMLAEEAPWPRQFDEFDKDPEIRKWRAELSNRSTVQAFNTDPASIDIHPALTRWALQQTEKIREYRKAILAGELAEAILKESTAYQRLVAANSSIRLIQSIAANQTLPPG